jgi:hypothetical protein
VTLQALTADRLEGRGGWTRWQADPAGFCRVALGEHPWSLQTRILEAIRDNRHTAVQSGHGVGKAGRPLGPSPGG